MKAGNSNINRLLLQYNFKWYCAALLMVLSIASWVIFPLSKGELNVIVFIGVLLLAIVLPLLPFLFNAFKNWRKQKLIKLLNESISPIDYSSRLLFKRKAGLNALEQLQVASSNNFIEQNYTSIKLKHNLGVFFIFFILNLLAVFFFCSFESSGTSTSDLSVTNLSPETNQLNEVIVKNDTLLLLQHNILIRPPSYTRLKTKTQKELNIVAPEGSKITWSYQFNRTTENPALNVRNDSLPFETKGASKYEISFKFRNNAIYSIQLKDTIESPFLGIPAEIKLVKDQPPIVKMSGLKAYEEFDMDDINTIDFNYELSDDYGIRNAEVHLILSSGSGESVQFKEDYIQLKRFKNNTSYQKNIELNKYEPKPGDEFYIRIRGTDNKPGKPNTSYSSTFIVAIKDTTKIVATFEMALGLDVEPEYFRSQRQLIIDTENLLEQQPSLQATAFKEQSNNIGIDQKVLRLRYGKFLGEEFEGEIGVRKDAKKQSVVNEEEYNDEEEHDKHKHQECEHDHHDHETIETDEEDHIHNEDCEYNHSEEEKHKTNEHNHQHHNHDHDHNHDHSNESEDPEQEENLLAPFIHSHDSAEMNTFFESEVKTKLKAALAEMWQSELQLRIGDPKTSLPYQHKALKLIKEVQQASRVYVERVGLKLPKIPVAKKRLTGELDDVEDLSLTTNFNGSKNYDTLKDVVKHFNKVSLDELSLPQNIELIHRLVQELYIASKNVEIQFSKSIYLTQQLLNDKNKLADNYFNLKRNLNNLLLNIEGEQSGKKTIQSTRLTNLFQQYLYN